MQDDDKPQLSFNKLLTKNPVHASFLFASQRTGLAFQRTRLSADRTLMAVIRTSLSLISFGFTIFQIFWHLKEEFHKHWRSLMPRILGFILVILGILMLVIGIAYQVRFMKQIRIEREDMMNKGLLPDEDKFPVSFTLIIATLLLFAGIFAAIYMGIQVLKPNINLP
ncbi:hypothetical protein HYPMC_3624 [Sporocytophaga myxococcoides]|uniref:DUF202 domain-containing protein n=1 Tax=Sporocytophaga myxococcoides TaxID=153721 RepID=A0A098LF72_9BACT|nr:DUF202 domain-containing protein [Sporocytophaga myxococcoides]GAL85626.1 hypothetical protein HYPMC_3624 [Sporocytophaga myxococcoides]